MKNKLLIVLFFCVAKANSQTNQFTTVSNMLYKISFPANWTIDSSKTIYNTKFLILSPLEDSTDTFKENVNLLSLPADTSLEMYHYLQLTEKEFERMATDGTILLSELKEGPNGWFHHFSFYMLQGKTMLWCNQYILLHKQQLHVLTFTSLKAKQKQYQQIAHNILSSFVLFN
jgi:hypothetical protein